ncbi:MAG: hypothetical protein NC921_03965 [Candidatus Omnitrophica bacterium]|nr:hypothetical protein [Candidatus Omnitrophota bacterium]
MKVSLDTNYLAKMNWFIDLGDEGNFYIEDETVDVFSDEIWIRGTYEYEGWKFSNCILTVRISPDEFNYVEEIFSMPWDDWTVEPDDTEILEWGEFEDIKGSVFEDLVVEKMQEREEGEEDED